MADGCLSRRRGGYDDEVHAKWHVPQVAKCTTCLWLSVPVANGGNDDDVDDDDDHGDVDHEVHAIWHVPQFVKLMMCWTVGGEEHQ